MARRAIQVDDLFRMNLVGDVQISPDGDRMVYTVKRTDKEKNKYFTRLYLADDLGSCRTLTADGHYDGHPRWSPDGSRVAFLSNRDKPKSQIFVIDPDGGEAEAITNLPEGGIDGFAWSPDGTKLAFIFSPTPEHLTEKAVKEREEKGLSRPVRVHQKLGYRFDGMGYYEGVHKQLWVVDASTGESKAVVDLPHHCQSFAWSPDSASLAFAMNMRDDDDIEYFNEDLFMVSAAGGELKQIAAPGGYKHSLAWSSEGNRIAFVSDLETEYSWGGKNERVVIVHVDGAGEASDLTGATDREVGWVTLGDCHEVGGSPTVQWSHDGEWLYFPLSQDGDTRLCRAPSGGGAVEDLTPSGHEVSAFSVSRDGTRLGIGIGSASDFYEAQILSLEQGKASVVVSLPHNQEMLEELSLQDAQPFQVTSADGWTVHGWKLVPPSGGANHPCVLYVHGGPAAQYGGVSTPFHELQWLCANGYVVVFANPRGSKGYGEAHCEAIRGDWGNKDWMDIQAVADYAAALPEVDADRMAIMGGSYGGWMTGWAVGHTDRFKCAIADRMVSNLHSMSGTTDFGWNHGKAWKGNSWSDPSDLWKGSPLAYAGNVNTPVLIIHSDGDLRCPVSQAEEYFAALREQRKVVELVRYPAESSHGMSRNGPPDLRIDRLDRNLAWLNRWLKGSTE